LEFNAAIRRSCCSGDRYRPSVACRDIDSAGSRIFGSTERWSGDEVPGDAESTGKVNCEPSSVVRPLLRPLSSAERQTTMSLD
jgi:hypothetical protein